MKEQIDKYFQSHLWGFPGFHYRSDNAENSVLLILILDDLAINGMHGLAILILKINTYDAYIQQLNS